MSDAHCVCRTGNRTLAEQLVPLQPGEEEARARALGLSATLRARAAAAVQALLPQAGGVGEAEQPSSSRLVLPGLHGSGPWGLLTPQDVSAALGQLQVG